MDPTRRNLFLISGLIIIFTAVVANSIFQLQTSRLQALKESVVEEESKNRVLAEVGPMEKRIDGYQPRLAHGGDVEWLRSKVIETAHRAQVKIISISPSRQDEKKLYIRVPITAGLECGYHQLGDFISKLESSKQFIKVDSIDLTVEKAEEGASTAKVDLTLSTFFLKE